MTQFAESTAARPTATESETPAPTPARAVDQVRCGPGWYMVTAAQGVARPGSPGRRRRSAKPVHEDGVFSS